MSLMTRMEVKRSRGDFSGISEETKADQRGDHSA